MPRRSRIDAAGALHHVIMRGIEGSRVFCDDSDRNDFLRRLSLVVKDRTRVRARSLFCYFAVRESGVSQVDLVKRLKLSPSAVTFSVKRGELLARERGFTLQ